jgi:TnpA family transposase
MATAALRGDARAPRLKDIKAQTLDTRDRQQHSPPRDPILPGTVQPPLIRQAWADTLRGIASLEERSVSPSLVLHRLGSSARRHRVYQGLAELGRVHKTVPILQTRDDAADRRRMGRERKKGDAAPDRSRLLCFGTAGVLCGRACGEQLHTLRGVSILHHAVVAWNRLQLDPIVAP